MTIHCPYCRKLFDCNPSDAGAHAECSGCNNKFVIPDPNYPCIGDLSFCTYAELENVVLTMKKWIVETLKVFSEQQVLTDLEFLRKELDVRSVKLKCDNDAEAINRWPVIFRCLKGLIVNHREITNDEVFVSQLVLEVNQCFKMFEGKIDAINEKNKKIEGKAMLRCYQDGVTEFIHCVKVDGAPRRIQYKLLSPAPGEVVYFMARNSKCVVCHATKTDTYEDGVFIVTNQRVMFVSDNHKQVYKVGNIRDFDPCWNVKYGSIMVASSDRRKECFYIESPWLASAIILYLWSDTFREKMLNQSEGECFTEIWGKVSPSACEYVHSGGTYVTGINEFGLNEYYVNGKTYVDVSGRPYDKYMWDVIGRLAQKQNTDIITDWDKMSGKFDHILKGDMVK